MKRNLREAFYSVKNYWLEKKSDMPENHLETNFPAVGFIIQTTQIKLLCSFSHPFYKNRGEVNTEPKPEELL